MEFLLVLLDDSREVRVGGVPVGRTNVILELEAGIHRVALGPPNDVSPLDQRVRLANTAAMDPVCITFHRLPPAAIPLSPGSPL
jgi:hypothetical protein